MNALTQQIIHDLRRVDDRTDTTELRNHFESVLDTYIQGNYPCGYEESTLMCSILDSFPQEQGHNCLGCNLEEQSALVIRFLADYDKLVNQQAVATQFHWLLYLLAERYNQYIEMMKIPEETKQRHFKVFQQVIQWANFIKHPKAFVLVHHPEYYFDGIDIDSSWQEKVIAEARTNKQLIDNDFVKQYYAGGDNNPKLFAALSNKENVVVLFPNPLKLMQAFVKAQQEFVNLIKENKVFRDIIGNKATLKAAFVEQPNQP